MSTTTHIIAVIAATAITAAVTYHLLKQRTVARHQATLATPTHTAQRDSLTGLGDRTGFHEALADAADRRRPLAVILINLDGSRAFVGRFGHRAFDQLLVLTAGRIQRVASAAGGSSFRLRRDEFGVIVGDLAGVTDLAARFIGTVAEPTEIYLADHPVTVTVTACAGVATFPAQDIGDPRLVLMWADRAMRAAKQAGRGQVAIFENAAVRHLPGVPYPPATPGVDDGGVTR